MTILYFFIGFFVMAKLLDWMFGPGWRPGNLVLVGALLLTPSVVASGQAINNVLIKIAPVQGTNTTSVTAVDASWFTNGSDARWYFVDTAGAAGGFKRVYDYGTYCVAYFTIGKISSGWPQTGYTEYSQASVTWVYGADKCTVVGPLGGGDVYVSYTDSRFDRKDVARAGSPSGAGGIWEFRQEHAVGGLGYTYNTTSGLISQAGWIDISRESSVSSGMPTSAPTTNPSTTQPTTGPGRPATMPAPFMTQVVGEIFGTAATRPTEDFADGDPTTRPGVLADLKSQLGGEQWEGKVITENAHELEANGYRGQWQFGLFQSLKLAGEVPTDRPSAEFELLLKKFADASEEGTGSNNARIFWVTGEGSPDVIESWGSEYVAAVGGIRGLLFSALDGLLWAKANATTVFAVIRIILTGIIVWNFLLMMVSGLLWAFGAVNVSVIDWWRLPDYASYDSSPVPESWGKDLPRSRKHYEENDEFQMFLRDRALGRNRWR